MNLRLQVTSGLRWVAGTRFLGQLFTWTVTIAVLRLLTPADYGLLAMATVFVDFLAMMAQFGLGAAVIQAVSVDERKLQQIFGMVVVANLGLFIVMYFAAPLIATFFQEQRLIPIVRVLSMQYILAIFAMIPDAELSRKLDYRRLSLVELTASIAASLTTLGLALTGSGVWALVWGSLLGVLWRTVALNLLSPFFKWPRFSYQGTRELLLFGGNVTVTRILWFVYSQADVIIAGKVLGKELLGSYSVAMHLASFPTNKISAIVNQVSFPAFARIQHDRERYASNFLLAVRLLSFCVFPVLWGISSIAPELVSVLLGSKWLLSTVPLQLLALIMPVHMFAPFMNTAALGLGRADIAAKQVLIASLIMPAAFLIGSQWGLVGLAAAWLVAFPLVFIGAMVLFLQIIRLRIRDLLGAMAPPVAASLGMYAMVAVIRVILGPATGEVARMTALIFAGIVAYGVLSLVINRDGCREVIRTLQG